MSAERIAELKTKIAAFDTALEELATGKRVVKMSYDGNSVDYGPGDAALLKELRTQAKAELARLTCGTRGPFRMAY
jgi:hypothetical protein